MSADGHGAFDLIFGETARWTRVLGFLASSPRWLLPTGPPWRRNFHSRRSRRSSARSTATRRTPPTRSSTSNGNTTSAMPSSWPPIAASIRGCRARGLESSYRRSISCRTRRAVVINLGERRLYYFPPDGKHVETFPIGVGVEGKKTLIGTTTVVAKEKNPTWFPPPSIHQELVAQVTAAAGGRVNEVDWDAVNRAGLERSGIPVAVLSDAPVISSNNVGVAPQQSSAQQSAPQTGAEPPVAAAFQYVPGEEPRFFPAVPPGDREAASRVE